MKPHSILHNHKCQQINSTDLFAVSCHDQLTDMLGPKEVLPEAVAKEKLDAEISF